MLSLAQNRNLEWLDSSIEIEHLGKNVVKIVYFMLWNKNWFKLPYKMFHHL